MQPSNSSDITVSNSTSTRAQKYYKRAPNGVKHIHRTMEQLNLTVGQLSNAIGQSSNYVSNLLARGHAPAWTTLACECLVRRQGRSFENVQLLVNAPADKKKAVLEVLSAMDISFQVIEN